METHFILYFTTDASSGDYYLGRHTTTNPEDGYIGSGLWVSCHENRDQLRAEKIIQWSDGGDPRLTAIYEKRLVALEGQFLERHYGKPHCQNKNPDPVGFTSANNPMKDPNVRAKLSGENHWTKRPENADSLLLLRGDNHWMNQNPEAKKRFLDNHPNADGKNAKAAVASGRHIWHADNPSIRRTEEGIHHTFRRPDGTSIGGDANKKRVEEGTHNFLGPELNQKRIEEGTHNFLGSSLNEKMLAEGTHPSQRMKTCDICNWTVPGSMFKRWHGPGRCHMDPESPRYNPNLKPRIKNQK